MIRLRRVRTVAWFELTSTVRRIGYLVITFGMPLFGLIYAAIALIPIMLMERQLDQPRVFGLVDTAGVLALEPDEVLVRPKAELRAYRDEPAARKALLEQRIRSYFVIAPDYLESGRVSVYVSDRTARGAWDGREEINELLRRRLGARHALGQPTVERLVKPIQVDDAHRVKANGDVEDEAGEARIGRMLLPMGFVLLLFSSIMMSGSYLIQATATEKENKVVEVLLSSASADEIMTGKLLGLGAAGLLQVLIWLSMSLGAGLGFGDALAPFKLSVPWQAVAASPLLFVAAYAFLCSLMLGTGSLGGNVRDAQQLGMIWALFAALPLVFMPALLTDPNGLISKVLTWIPFSAPVTLVFRLCIEPNGVTAWELTGSVLVLLLSIWVALRIASRLFRIGLLLTGARPSLRAMIKQARLPR